MVDGNRTLTSVESIYAEVVTCESIRTPLTCETPTGFKVLYLISRIRIFQLPQLKSCI